MTPERERPPGSLPSRTRQRLGDEVQSIFDDARFKHLIGFGDRDDSEPEDLNHDRPRSMQAAASMYRIRSAD